MSTKRVPGGEDIRGLCPVPRDKGQVLRVASESLALKYRLVYEGLQMLTGRRFPRLHAGGGGILNELLSQATADALGIEVVAGPVEATSCGNVITQMIGSRSAGSSTTAASASTAMAAPAPVVTSTS